MQNCEEQVLGELQRRAEVDFVHFTGVVDR